MCKQTTLAQTSATCCPPLHPLHNTADPPSFPPGDLQPLRCLAEWDALPATTLTSQDLDTVLLGSCARGGQNGGREAWPRMVQGMRKVRGCGGRVGGEGAGKRVTLLRCQGEGEGYRLGAACC
jgi:hypothetical protein